MQASERYRLMELYRDETAGRLGLGAKCAACVSVLSVLALVAGAADDRGVAETPAHAVARPVDGNAYYKETATHHRRVVSVAPVTAP